jgi:RNA polymerase sigma factor (sigma-70 family)
MGMVHNREDALELTQETFVKAYENLERFKGESSFYTWLYRIVVNLGIDFRRRDRRHGTVSLADRPGGGEDIEWPRRRNNAWRIPISRRDRGRSVSACNKRSTS